jgi:ApaG protein
MEIAVTNGIKISVEVIYVPEHSIPMMNKYVHTYAITIENTTEYTVQLLRRFWKIIDSNGVLREVEGEGVVGLQPVIGPHESFNYSSWTDVFTDVGKMFGSFMMVRQMDGLLFQADVPEFLLTPPFKLN